MSLSNSPWWQPPSEEKINGILLGFRIRYRELLYDRLRTYSVHAISSVAAWADLTGKHLLLLLLLLYFLQCVFLMLLLLLHSLLLIFLLLPFLLLLLFPLLLLKLRDIRRVRPEKTAAASVPGGTYPQRPCWPPHCKPPPTPYPANSQYGCFFFFLAAALHFCCY